MHALTLIRARSTWLKLHLWLALGVGFFYSLIGLSGSLLVYGDGLDALLNPRLTLSATPREPLPLDRILAAVKAAQPGRLGPWTLELPRRPDGMITAWYERPKETREAYYAPLMVAVNPYTAEVVAGRFWGETAVTWVYRLHAEMHMGGFGANLIGVLGLVLSVSVVSGLVLWWPGVAGLSRAFAVRHDGGLRRMLVDLHRLLGVLGSLFLLLLALTGFHLVFPGLMEGFLGASAMGHGEDIRTVRSTAAQNDNPVKMQEAVLLARGLFPRGEVRRVTEPDGAAGTYRIELLQREEPYSRHPATWIWVDRWSGQIREAQNPRMFSEGERWLSRIWPLHTGEALGGAGRLLWFVVGLLPLTLYLSGLVYWLIGRGVLRDAAVDFRRWGTRGLALLHAVRNLGLRAYPHLLAGWRRLLRLLADIRRG
ncbi:PepSY domain-containing protein [Methylococcus sp. EFPC2]|uniref:PepSY-associated TM helix domain-containing protein n=1 Tax=Methylococcus sp. EFPC2 TaxID=2812648 RepID=UPI001967BE4B|nr:PepSY-associated TM helix domain-containing protein [Methylococcus sp. EFPC2]QSA97027.1 PepSY domain-containing protein [Methylococcus sp. EFPC2]